MRTLQLETRGSSIPSGVVSIDSRRPERKDSEFAQRIREVARQHDRVLFDPRWVEAMMRTQHDDLSALSVDEFHAAVGLAINAMDALPPAEIEATARSFGL
jgi:hypothetical protein